MPSENTKILEFNQHQQSDKPLLIIYEDRECIIEKVDWCKNNPENWSTKKVSEHIPSCFSMSSFRSIEKTHKKINFKKKKVNSLRKKQEEPCKNAKICYICQEKFENKWFER